MMSVPGHNYHPFGPLVDDAITPFPPVLFYLSDVIRARNYGFHTQPTDGNLL